MIYLSRRCLSDRAADDRCTESPQAAVLAKTGLLAAAGRPSSLIVPLLRCISDLIEQHLRTQAQALLLPRIPAGTGVPAANDVVQHLYDLPRTNIQFRNSLYRIHIEVFLTESRD